MASINADAKSGPFPVRTSMVIKTDQKPSGKSADAPAPAAGPKPAHETGLDPITKEKTPMCLVNELARFNKLKHQYTLVDEQGPAHKKTFFVQLKLGDEEYNSMEGSIKRAQHLAAQQALQQSRYKKPPPKDLANLSPYEPTLDKVLRLTPAPAPNPPGFKKAQKAATTATVQQPSQKVNPQAKGPGGPGPKGSGGPGPKGPGGPGPKGLPGPGPKGSPGSGQAQRNQQVRKPAGSAVNARAQASVNRARNFIQNRNGNSGFGGQGSRAPYSAFGSGSADMAPPFKRARIEMPPAMNSGSLLRSAIHDHETVAIKRERIEQEWEKVALMRQQIRMEEERLNMEKQKFDMEFRILEYKLKKYEDAAVSSSKAQVKVVPHTAPVVNSNMNSSLDNRLMTSSSLLGQANTFDDYGLNRPSYSNTGTGYGGSTSYSGSTSYGNYY